MSASLVGCCPTVSLFSIKKKKKEIKPLVLGKKSTQNVSVSAVPCQTWHCFFSFCFCMSVLSGNVHFSYCVISSVFFSARLVGFLGYFFIFMRLDSLHSSPPWFFNLRNTNCSLPEFIIFISLSLFHTNYKNRETILSNFHNGFQSP